LFISLWWTMNMLFDFYPNKMPLILDWSKVIVLFCSFIYVMWAWNVLDNVHIFLGLFLIKLKNNLLNYLRTFWTLTEFISFNVLWSLDSSFDLYFVCVLVNQSRTHKYQELSKSINHLIIIDAFNDFLIQSRNPFLHMICSRHFCSCMFLVWTWNFGFALTNLLNNLLNSFWVHTYELQNVSSWFLSFLTDVLYVEHSDVLKYSYVLQHFKPYG